ncbi:PXDN [Mytilus edulis]|uniref:PXDN n=1 Tax=Mytilus edulis TaxID=6550 RepID=A0A8S3QKP5_MYTED|nr:PXDN [Mytilus edulis]
MNYPFVQINSESSIQVEYGALPIVQVGNRAYESVYGEDVTLVCGISSEPFINNVYWTKDANGTQTIINQRSVGFQDLPDVKAPIPTIEISFGDSVDLICNVKANPLHDLVYWEHNVTGVIRRIFKETDGANGCTVENPSLSIDYVTNTVSGLYTCFAKNVVGVSHSSAINVTVKGGLPEVVIDVRNYKTIYGNKIVLDCKVTAYPKVSLVYWQKQSNNVITTLYNGSVGTEGITIDFPSLVLTRPVNADSGIYTCFASNIAGTQKSLSTKLTVEGGLLKFEIHPK